MTLWKYEIKRKMSLLLMRGCAEFCWHFITTNNCTVWLNEETPVSLHTRVVCIHLLATMLVRWVRFGHNMVNSRVIKLSSLQITGNGRIGEERRQYLTTDLRTAAAGAGLCGRRHICRLARGSRFWRERHRWQRGGAAPMAWHHIRLQAFAFTELSCAEDIT